MEHVLIRRLEHLTGTKTAPKLSYAIEMRDRAGPAHKSGAFPGDVVWVQLRGGLFVAKAIVRICWIGEFSRPEEIRARTKGSPLVNVGDFWQGRPRYGYAAVAALESESWLRQPFWAGPRTYGYEWVLLENDKKRASWLDKKAPPRTSDDLGLRFKSWLKSH